MIEKSSPKEIAALLYKRTQGTLSEAETVRLQEWAASYEVNKQLLAQLDDESHLTTLLTAYHPENKQIIGQRIYKKISAQVPVLARGRIKLWTQWTKYAAAIVFFGICATLFYHYSGHQQSDMRIGNHTEKEIDKIVHPGRQGAVLTLSDGREIVIDHSLNEKITDKGSMSAQIEGGKLTYADKGAETEQITYNTVVTPRGRHFELQLSDGTQVWLNAASSITYPTSFPGTERHVKITGEAYFKVARNVQKPFKIAVAGKDTIAVLGTQFNVNAYGDEAPVVTTLMEGSVRVSSADKDFVKLTRPGHQATIKQNGSINLTYNPEYEQVIAWKDGIFSFNDTKLRDVMRQLSRWYDVDIIYDKEAPDILLEGHLQREASFSTVLLYLEKIGVKCKLINGKLHIIN